MSLVFLLFFFLLWKFIISMWLKQTLWWALVDYPWKLIKKSCWNLLLVCFSQLDWLTWGAFSSTNQDSGLRISFPTFSRHPSLNPSLMKILLIKWVIKHLLAEKCIHIHSSSWISPSPLQVVGLLYNLKQSLSLMYKESDTLVEISMWLWR